MFLTEKSAIVEKKSNLINHYNNKIALEPVVVNGHLLTPKETVYLLSIENTSTTTTTTVRPWKPAGLIGEADSSSILEEIKPFLEGEHQNFETFRKNQSKNSHVLSSLQDEQGFLNTFVIRGFSDMFHKKKDNSVAEKSGNVDAQPVLSDAGKHYLLFKTILISNILNIAKFFKTQISKFK